MTQDIAALILFLSLLGIGALISVSMNKKHVYKKEKIERKRKFKVINGGKK